MDRHHQIQGRALVVLAAAVGVLAIVTAGLAFHVSGENARTAESACRSSLLAITPSTTVIEPFLSRDLDSIDTATEPEVAEAVESFARSPQMGIGPRSTYIVQGEVVFGKSEPTRITCLVVLEGGKALTAPFFATSVD